MKRRPPAPPNAVLAEIVTILGQHRVSPTGGSWHCICGKADYGPRTRAMGERAEKLDAHDMHLGRVLVAEGLTMAGKDPRENFIRRARQNDNH